MELLRPVKPELESDGRQTGESSCLLLGFGPINDWISGLQKKLPGKELKMPPDGMCLIERSKVSEVESEPL